MFRKYILPLIAILGVSFGIYTAIRGARTIPPAPPVSEAPEPGFREFVAGSGMVEASTENIAIGTQIAGIVSNIWVEVGSRVKTGDPLFTIDPRAQSSLVTVKRAAVEVAEAQAAQAKYEFEISEGLHEKKVVSAELHELRRYAVQTAEAQLAQAQADFSAATTDLDRLTVRAPVDGAILQLKIHLGEFAPTGALQQPLILLGSITPMSVRVNVDENDAWRVRAGAAAIGYLRGNKEIHVPLRFVRFEPFVVPKVSLTGDSSERVDTRVLQVIYYFEPAGQPIFLGQQMDVFIDASAPSTPAARSASISH